MHVKPSRDLLIGYSRSKQILYVLSLDALETEKHVVEWTVEVVLARCPI